MIANDIIVENIPPLKVTDTGEKALIWMKEFGVDHLPVIDDLQFVGLVSEDDILDINRPDEPFKDYHFSYQRPYVPSSAHIYEVVKLAVELHLSLIPVVQNEKYIGTITLESLIQNIAKVTGANDPGGIIKLEIEENNYSLSEIARIVESNDANILSTYVLGNSESKNIQVTLKVSISDLSHILATFERFNYTVIATFQESEYFEHLKERYDSFMKYLNI